MLELARRYLRSVYSYDENSGVVAWKRRPVEDFKTERAWKIWNARFPGTVAGNLTEDGYIDLSIGESRMPAHRIIWLLVYGEMPDQIDHINGIRSDNRLSNIRAVDNKTNLKNQSLRATNKSGVMGVVQRSYGSWRAEIGVDGKRINLGTFIDKQDAIAARLKAERRYGFHENHGRPKAAASVSSQPA